MKKCYIGNEEVKFDNLETNNAVQTILFFSNLHLRTT